MLTDAEKLNQIRAILETPTAPAPVELKAYDRPQLKAEEVKLDNVTVNPDGSVWGMQSSFTASGTTIPGGPVCLSFGYISPVKTPEIWEHARKVLSPDYFPAWDAAWRKNPYGLYRADIPALLRAGTEVNTVLFAMLTEASGTCVQ
jgi:hypothetical protein